MKTKTKRSRSTVGLSTSLLVCALFFLGGLYFSTLFSSVDVRSRAVIKQSINDNGLAHGATGESSFESISFQILSWSPRAVYFPNFATMEQCNAIIELAKPLLGPSLLALRKGETAENTNGTRTSSGTFVYASDDETGTIASIERKIARATMIPTTYGEPFNVLRYEIGQKYDCHLDAFNPNEYGPQESQRVASFLLYLTNVEEGGETMFPYENGTRIPGYDYKQCIGLKVKPRQGDGLLFYNVFPNTTIDRKSLHGSCPVIKGEKWVATKWIRDQLYLDD
ncbi:Probable prolyl 4-hydroxylase 9 [Linum perenne]